MRDSSTDSLEKPDRPDGFQARGQAWDPLREDIVSLLEQAEHTRLQPIYYGSNHCFMATLDGGEAGSSYAVYKPARGEYPLYDFPSGTLYRREVGTWLINRALGWNVVPPTVVTRGKYGVGSLQLFIESYDEGELAIEELRRLVLLDVILNNADRKSEHCLLGEDGKLWGIDHGLTFHVQPKLRTVLWHFAGRPFHEVERCAVERLVSDLQRCKTAEVKAARDLVTGAEWRALTERANRLVDSGRFPDPRYKAVPYRW
jgi:hypothetical protein